MAASRVSRISGHLSADKDVLASALSDFIDRHHLDERKHLYRVLEQDLQIEPLQEGVAAPMDAQREAGALHTHTHIYTNTRKYASIPHTILLSRTHTHTHTLTHTHTDPSHRIIPTAWARVCRLKGLLLPSPDISDDELRDKNFQ